jgi:hypothetical protein
LWRFPSSFAGILSVTFKDQKLEIGATSRNRPLVLT